MSGFIELLSKIGNENIEYQMLTNSITSIKQTKKHAKVEFITNAITASDIALDTAKKGIIIWVDGEILKIALSEIKADCDANAPPLQAKNGE